MQIVVHSLWQHHSTSSPRCGITVFYKFILSVHVTNKVCISSNTASVVSFTVKRSDHYVQRYEPNCAKNAVSRNVEESLKTLTGFVSGSGRLPKSNQFFLVHRYI